ncbi:N-acetylglucosaminyldiphosphoundecaprenol N-acetyl-beta-D-mannosaminyltransferase [Aquabacterium sp. CECT 9606]|nr:N-acetylglucosaminyldiphosphoundecaprenol N-acetyl-beta-D-mannosaminyltransferase [Aquabacterium sp. CECT 9606]
MRHPDPNFGYPSLSFLEREQVLGGLKQQAKKKIIRSGAYVLDTFIDATSWDEAISRIADWGAERQSRYVTLCNVHSVVTGSQTAKFANVINGADMALPDGAPVAWMMRKEGFAEQQRISGPDLMLRYLAEAERRGQSVFFYGSVDDTLAKLRGRLMAKFPKLKIAGMASPPFRKLTEQEDAEYTQKINASGAHVVFVGLGCPKQEIWMAEHRGAIKAVMVGVGAAFDYHAGTLRRAPAWMQQRGLEWLYRFVCEPRRLARRYIETNSVFVGKLMVRSVFGRNPKHQKG